MLRVLELFAGIGACSKALERLGIEHEIVDAVEIDKYAIKSFNAVHGTNFEPQDITKWDKDIEVDFIIHGSPCQDFSVAGLGKGGDKGSGTRSSLMYETLRIVEKLKPKYVIWENVKNLLSKKHRHNFDAYLDAMAGLGYTSKYQVLNAKDYGVPQNRERVFTVSILKDERDETICLNSKGGRNGVEGLQPSRKDRVYSSDGVAATIATSDFYNPYYKIEPEFNFPEPMPLTKKLKDVLEDEVDEKYYLSDEQVASFKASTAKAQAKGNGFKFEPIERESSSHDRHEAGQSADGQLHSGVVGRVEAINGHDILKRVYGTDGVSPTLSTMEGGNREPKIVASRGRGGVQQLEARKDGLTNTITSVQKDNFVRL